MKHYLFVETISGIEFIVGEDSVAAAKEFALSICKDIALEWNGGADNFNCLYCGTLTEEEAESSGLDEY